MWLLRRALACKQVLLGVLLGIALTTVLVKTPDTTSLPYPQFGTRQRMCECSERATRLEETIKPPEKNNTLGLYGKMDGVSDDIQSKRDIRRGDLHFDDTASHDDDDSVARHLAERIRVMCMVITMPKNLGTKAVYVRDTWGNRCTKLLFFSSQRNDSLPAIGLNVSEGRDNLTPKHNQAFKYVYERHMNDADWFFKVDDDTYAIMENLRYFLSAYNPDDPIYFGSVYKVLVKQGYPSGGSGYVLSKEAFRRFGERGLNASLCRQNGTASDLALGKCMEALGVKLMPIMDAQGRSTFHSAGMSNHILGTYPAWYHTYDPVGANMTAVNMSDFAISFHYTDGTRMMELEYLIYHLLPYGIVRKFPPLPSKRDNR